MSPRNLVYHLYESVPFTEKRPRRPETGINDGFEEIEHEFLFGIFCPEKTGLTFQMFRCSRKFAAGTTKKVMFHLLSNRIFRNLFVNGKQPGFWWEKLLSKHEKQTKKMIIRVKQII